MKLEKEVTLNTYGLSVICFNKNFTQNEIRELQQMYKRKIKLTLETEEPILDEAERKYLSDVIRPFRDDVEFICKNCSYVDNEYINIGYYKNDNTLLPCFKKGTMYKGMELNKEYTLEELGL